MSVSLSAAIASSVRPAASSAALSGSSSARAAQVGAVGQQPQRGLVVARCGRRCGVLGVARRRFEQRDRVVVAGAREPLHVVGALRRRRPARGERGRGPLVSRDPPAGRCVVVHGAAHERVPKAECASRLGGTDQVRSHERVEQRERLGRLEAGGGGRDVGIERVACDRGAGEQVAGGALQTRHLASHGGLQGGGQRIGRVRADARQLLEEQRVALRLAGHAVA